MDTQLNNVTKISKRPKRFLTFGKVLATLIGIIVSVLVLEGSLRILEKVSGNNALVPAQTTLTKHFDHTLGMLYDPNQSGWFYSQSGEYKTFASFNSDGWHDTEHLKEKPDNVYRIVIIGDSFVESLQVSLENTFFRLLEQKLNDTSNQKVEIIALGLSDTGPAQQLEILRTIGLSYNPDLVMQMFLTANDIRNSSPQIQYNNLLPYYTLSSDGSLILIPPSESLSHTNSPSLNSLRIVRLIKKARYNYHLYKQSAMQNDYHIDLHVYDETYSDLYTNGWNLTEKIIAETKRLTESAGSDYMLVTLANNEQLNDEVWNYYLAHNPAMREAHLDREKPEKIVLEICERNGISCAFMLPSFKEYIQRTGTITHFPFDGHWNETGHMVAADFLYDTITKYREKNFN